MRCWCATIFTTSRTGRFCSIRAHPAQLLVGFSHPNAYWRRIGRGGAARGWHPLEPEPLVPTADYTAGMRRLAGGVTIVTTRLGEARAGLTATSVCSLTAEPPRLLACVHREADAHGLISSIAACSR